MEGLEARRNRNDGREVGILNIAVERIELGRVRADGTPAPVTEQCTESLAPGQQTLGTLVDHIEVGGDGPQLGSTFGEELIETDLHQVHKPRTLRHVPTLSRQGCLQ